MENRYTRQAQEALDAAHAVAADEEATQEAVDSAAQALNAAIGALNALRTVASNTSLDGSFARL